MRIFSSTILSYILFTSIIIWQSCSQQTTEAATLDPEVAVQEKIKPQAERLTACTTLDDLGRSIRSKTEDAFTLYRDQVKFKNYAAAKDLWKQAFYTAPGANGRAQYHFDDGVKIYNFLFSEADAADKQGIVDTVLSIYDKRIDCFGDVDGILKARKAFDCYYQYREFCNPDETFAWFREVADSQGEKTPYFMVNPFSRMLYDRVLDESIGHEAASKYANQIFEIITYGKSNCKDKYCDAWKVIEEYAPNLLSGLEGIRDFYDCDYYMNKYYAQFEENPTDCENVTEVYLKMVWARCDKDAPNFIALKEAKDKECYVEPPPPGPLKKASEALNNGQFSEAITFYEEYVAGQEDPVKKANILLRISKIYYAHIKNFPASRRYALRAAEYRSNWGAPYMLIGKLYASSGPLCGPGRGWDSQIVTWPAIDKFRYAKQIDPSVAAEADDWIRRYRKYMPKKEDLFMRKLKNGGSFTVPCWIQERTTIRSAD